MAELVIDLLRDCTATKGACQANPPKSGEKTSILTTSLIGEMGFESNLRKPIRRDDVRRAVTQLAVGTGLSERCSGNHGVFDASREATLEVGGHWFVHWYYWLDY